MLLRRSRIRLESVWIFERLCKYGVAASSVCRTQSQFDATFDEKCSAAAGGAASRWSLVCSSLADWKCLANRLRASEARCEQRLYRCLLDDFLPQMPALLDYKVRSDVTLPWSCAHKQCFLDQISTVRSRESDFIKSVMRDVCLRLCASAVVISQQIS